MPIVYNPKVFELAQEQKSLLDTLCKTYDVNKDISVRVSQVVYDAIIASYRLGYLEGESND